MGVTRGRPGIARTIPESKLLRAYQVYGSANAAAHALGIHHSTMLKFLRGIGIDPRAERRNIVRVFSSERVKKGQFARWLLEHPNTPLPPSNGEIARITGCSYYSISCHYYRQRELIRKRLAAIPNIVPLGALLQSEHGENSSAKVVNTRSFLKYYYDFDPYSLNVWIIADTKEEKDLKFPIPDLDSFERAVQALVDGKKL